MKKIGFRLKLLRVGGGGDCRPRDGEQNKSSPKLKETGQYVEKYVILIEICCPGFGKIHMNEEVFLS